MQRAVSSPRESGTRVSRRTSSEGVYLITWSDSFSARCAAIATVLGPVAGLGASSGYANARVTGVHPTGVFVSTYGPDGKQAPAPFSVVVVC